MRRGRGVSTVASHGSRCSPGSALAPKLDKEGGRNKRDLRASRVSKLSKKGVGYVFDMAEAMRTHHCIRSCTSCRGFSDSGRS